MELFNKREFIEQVSVDCVIFGFYDRQLRVLLPRLKNMDIWMVPGGFVRQNESLDSAALRILAERTGIKDIYLEQFGVFGSLERSSPELMRQVIELIKGGLGEGEVLSEDLEWLQRRFISIGYYALVDIHRVVPLCSGLDETCQWYDMKDLPRLAFDHADIIMKALESLRLMLNYKLIGFNLLPETFTMKEVQDLYETILDRPFRRNNFQKMILDLDILERLEKKFTGAANKAPYLYRFKSLEKIAD
ncbi:NrtR DNA-binding winged helix domain-containing protein [Emticicia sp. 21SJ11W-3]|uniref:NUDIX hydrolase n=1 Tax=Emticicia sp. 21SJ11W-3 TaxID=2916755 RepID=UPI00209E0591|nr:NUDIX domain-containing protein [Emticicia sp. 21SJ11W-3]UTA66775.1 NUDIX domain-containing protein [Emticicia sp. 21SJ11W-3]